MNANRLKNLLPKLRALGPYVAIELLLPGGTLIALLLWLSQSVGRGAAQVEAPPVTPPSSAERVI